MIICTEFKLKEVLINTNHCKNKKKFIDNFDAPSLNYLK